MPKPSMADQIKAVATLRKFALTIPMFANATATERMVKKAIDDLDNADVFAAIDEAEHGDGS